MSIKIYLFDSNPFSVEFLSSLPFLSKEDIDSFKKYKVEEVKKEKIVSTYLKYKYVGHYEINREGKPVSDSIFFNVSHSHGVVALTLDTSPIGIDIEKIREVDEELKHYISTDEEKSCIKDDKSFFEIWTSKESLVKCLGTGINTKPNKILALPINGRKVYKDKMFISKCLQYDDLVISITRESDEDFDISIIKEVN